VQDFEIFGNFANWVSFLFLATEAPSTDAQGNLRGHRESKRRTSNVQLSTSKKKKKGLVSFCVFGESIFASELEQAFRFIHKSKGNALFGKLAAN